MKKYWKWLCTIFILFFFCFCNKNNNASIVENKKDSTTVRIDSLYWRQDKIIELQIDKNLSHQNGFTCDSVVGIDYVGFDGEHSFFPVNKKGQFISTIIKTQKLDQRQIIRLNAIMGDSLTYKNPRIVGCYEPRLAFVYYKGNKVIGQTQICLSCAQLRSTAMTVNNEYGGLFNEKATQQIDNLRIELGLISKMKWE